MLEPNEETEKWSSDCSTDDKLFSTPPNNQVIRKFINSAIYVEKPVSAATSSESCSLHKYSQEDLLEFQNLSLNLNPTIKRCTCSVDQKSCSFHKDLKGDNHVPLIVKDQRKSMPNVSKPKIQTKLAQGKVTSFINMERDVSIQQWLVKKQEEKKKHEMQRKRIQEAKQKERQMLLEQERNNFKMWLENKKKAELDAKKKKEQKLEEQRLKELEKEKRQLENHLNYQLWLKKKEEIELERKINEQMSLIDDLEKRELQAKENERAFNEWLENSKRKKRPVPLNRGITSLCSSASVAYINPTPWNPAT